MDAWGIGLFVIGLVGYFIGKTRNDGIAKFFLWICGVGAGIFIGAIWAFQIVSRTLGW